MQNKCFTKWDYILIIIGIFGIIDTFALFAIGSSINVWNLLPAFLGSFFIVLAFMRQRLYKFLAKTED